MTSELEPVMGSNEYGQPTVNADAARAEYERAITSRPFPDMWVVAGNGSETPYMREGRWFLYVFNPGLGRHGELDLATDIVNSD